MRQRTLFEQPVVQATDVTYELHTLGWKAFQNLCVTITRETLGQTVESYASSRDGGRDGAFHGSWKPKDNEDLAGAFTIQCKYTHRPNASMRMSDLQDELEKAARLRRKGLADIYVLMTNHSLSGVIAEEIKREFKTKASIAQMLPLGSQWIDQTIRESARLRMLVPQVYGLGDLSQILDARALSQAAEILSSLGPDLAKIVVTDAYMKAAHALAEHGFVLLLGEPASGKSTIGAHLAVSAIDRWRCFTLKSHTAEDFVQHWNPHDPRRFFWIDDAFGATQYQRYTADAWNRRFPELQAAIKKGARVLFTSRDYIFKEASRDLKITAFPLLRQSQVIINVQELSLNEKEQILYNHIKKGDQPPEFKRLIKPFLPSVAASERFLPEIARRLGNAAFTKNLQLNIWSIKDFVERPVSFLMEVITNLDVDSRAAIAIVFMCGGMRESPIEFTSREIAAISRLGATPVGVIHAFNSLRGNLLNLMQEEGRQAWVFKHPTISEAFATVLVENPELLDIYLTGTPINKLVREVVCGEILIEGAKVVVPVSRYDYLSERLQDLPKRDGLSFLANRCSKSYLESYLKKYPNTYDLVAEPHAFLETSPAALLASKLHEYGILTAECKEKFVQTLKSLAVDTPDAGFLSYGPVCNMLTPEERDDILQHVREELLPYLEGTIDDWEYNYKSDDDTDSYFEPLVDTLQTYQDAYWEDSDAVADIEKAIEYIEKAKERLAMDYEGHDIEYEHYGGGRTEPSGVMERSTFDDVDK